MAEGNDVRNVLRRNPEIALAYQTYVACRSQDLIVAEIPKGERNVLRIAPKTTGFSVLPEPGGLLDQPHRLMEFFSHFREGETKALKKALS